MKLWEVWCGIGIHHNPLSGMFVCYVGQASPFTSYNLSACREAARQYSENPPCVCVHVVGGA